ncbi:MAG: glutamate synthase subunit beta [Rhodothermia bacterium]
MGKPTGFLEFSRQALVRRSPEQRLLDYDEVDILPPAQILTEQAARCMDCGIPFCQSGCPLDNVIPDWNDFIYRGKWKQAYERLAQTNNFPEFTGRVCPAPCESSCVLGINSDPVTIEQLEHAIIERAFEEGWIRPKPPRFRTGFQVAVVGSGPAGLACADQLNKVGHRVTVFERHDRIGGLLRYGIPDFKLEKTVLDRRLEILEAEGIIFETGVEVGVDLDIAGLLGFDAVVLSGGTAIPRDLPVGGRNLKGIHYALDFLHQQNRRIAGDDETSFERESILATDKNVIVIGGGDTGSDCVGTANRQGASSVIQFELLETPPETRPDDQPWPSIPMVMKTTSSHEEGCSRHWSIMTTSFYGEGGDVKGLTTVRVRPGAGRSFEHIGGSEQSWPADLVLLAIGYAGPKKSGLLDQLDVEFDRHGNVRTDRDYMTNIPGVFSAGDMRRGQSLVVWAIREGRDAAAGVDRFLGRVIRL